MSHKKEAQNQAHQKPQPTPKPIKATTKTQKKNYKKPQTTLKMSLQQNKFCGNLNCMNVVEL